MGLNLDLTQMLGIPDKLICPKCNSQTKSFAEDYDVECGNPNPNKGEWVLSFICLNCNHEWEQCFKIRLEAHDAKG